jgi:hypothetical protein
MKKIALIAGLSSVAAMTAVLWSMPAAADDDMSPSADRALHDKEPGQAGDFADRETNTGGDTSSQTGASGVPEPGVLPLLALGLGGLGFAALARKRAKV